MKPTVSSFRGTSRSAARGLFQAAIHDDRRAGECDVKCHRLTSLGEQDAGPHGYQDNDRKARHGINYEVGDSRERRLSWWAPGHEGPGLFPLAQVNVPVERAQLELGSPAVDRAVNRAVQFDARAAPSNALTLALGCLALPLFYLALALV